MSDSQKFYICEHCGNLLGLIDNMGVPLVCCGEEMKELDAKTSEAGGEKHLPVVTLSGDKLTVEVGSVSHPMTNEHQIEFVYVETQCGGQRKRLTVGGSTKVTFAFSHDKPKAVYAYCNQHGLWKTEIK